jgi:SdrD B-like domain/Secretion system C-terminal sorting domain
VDSVQLTLNLRVQIALAPTQFDWDNYAEIKSMTDTLNVVRDGDDVDSNPNSDSPWERQVVENHPWDNEIDGNGQSEAEDEDDHDFEQVKVTGALGDKVWKDTDGDGVQDINEPGVPNVVVTLYDCANNTIVKKDTTDGSGNYFFDFLIPLKSYYVRFTNPDPEQCGFTFKDRGQIDSLDSDVDASGVGPCTYIEPGERDSTYDAGLVAWASYGNYVWHDRDADGRQEGGEEGIEGVTVVLYNATTNLPVRSMLTDANGLYHFTKLMPGNYYAKYTYHPMWNLTDANRGNDTGDSDLDGSNGPGTNATTYLSPDEDDLTWDVGLWKCVCIAGDVWLDLDKDGIYDWEEKGINGLGVHLIDELTGATVQSLYTGIHPTTPSADGFFKFACAKPGRYYIRYNRPGHLGATSPFEGSDRNKDSDINHENGINTTRSFMLRSAEVLEGLGGGFQIKAVVGDYVWHDRNFNGLQEVNEPPVVGVKVQAINTSGKIVSESETGIDGNYMLDGLIQGDYYVKFTPPGTFGFTVSNNGEEQRDSDVDGTNGFGTTKTYRLITGDELQYVDAGLVSQVLPLEWLSFEGKYNGSFTELNWMTGVELNNDHFVIERRHEREKTFVEIGKELSQKNNNVATHRYGYDDFGITQSGLYYYRIKQVDREGSYTYSKTIAISVTKDIDLNVFIYPNPVDDELKIEIWLGEDAEIEARVMDENGKVVVERPFSRYLKAGKRQEPLNTSVLPGGHYVLQVKTATGLVNKKFSVAR